MEELDIAGGRLLLLTSLITTPSLALFYIALIIQITMYTHYITFHSLLHSSLHCSVFTLCATTKEIASADFLKEITSEYILGPGFGGFQLDVRPSRERHKFSNLMTKAHHH